LTWQWNQKDSRITFRTLSLLADCEYCMPFSWPMKKGYVPKCPFKLIQCHFPLTHVGIYLSFCFVLPAGALLPKPQFFGGGCPRLDHPRPAKTFSVKWKTCSHLAETGGAMDWVKDVNTNSFIEICLPKKMIVMRY